MGIKIVSKVERGQPRGVGQYWERLCAAIGKHGIGADWITLDEWAAGKAGADPARDIIIADNQDALAIQPEYAVIAVQHGCAMEHGLRCGTKPHIEMGQLQYQAARRARTFWVGCSDWSAYHCAKHTGVRADRVICGTVNTNVFFPNERQRARNTEVPVILHHAIDGNKGAEIVQRVAGELGSAFKVQLLKVPAKEVPDALRGADMWLSLSASEGLPTVVIEALATNLVVVGTDVGVLWPFASGKPMEARTKGVVGWLNDEVGATVFNWQWRTCPECIADFVRETWKARQVCNGRRYAMKWWSLEVFGQKWLEAIAAAMTRFGFDGNSLKGA